MKILALPALLIAALVIPASGQEIVYEPGSGITMPTVLKEVRPEYTERAKKAGARGNVIMKCVVGKDGKPADITVVKELDPDLDQAAVTALEQWEFKPGTRNGEVVPVRVTIEMTFTLK